MENFLVFLLFKSNYYDIIKINGDLMLKIIKNNFNNILNYILVILLFFLAIKKGGFYKTDIIFFSLMLEITGILSISYFYIKHKNNIKFDYLGILLLLLSISYLLPIIFNNYSSLNDSLSEFIRYFNIYIIYKIVKLSENKKIFKFTLIYLGVFLGIIGIDGISNRFLEGILKYFSSGYLNIDLTRMSSTIQYANALAIILLVSSIIVFEELSKSLTENAKSKIVLNYSILFFNLFCIVLTQSRTVMLIAFIYTFVYFIKNKNIEMIYIILILILQTAISSVFAFKYLYINTIYIYYLTIVSLIGIIFIAYCIYLIRKNEKVTKILFSKYKIIFSSIFLLGLVYVIVGINIYSPLKISEFSKDTVKRYVHNVEKDGVNTLKFSVSSDTEDSRYRINIYKISDSKELIKTFEYYNTVSGDFEFEFNGDNNIKSIELEFECYKGNIIVKNASLNEKNIKLNYVLLPTDIVYKLEDAIYGADSVNARILYVKDALRIWNLSLKNRIIGIGGEGFKNTYQLIQDENYTSTEVHNSFIQILVESGIIGFIIIVSIIIYYIVNVRNNVFKLAFLALILHSVFDLDFSYMIILCIFAILLGINQERNDKKGLKLGITIEMIMQIFICLFSFILLIKTNIAYFIDIPSYNDNITIAQEAEIVSKLEKKVILDASENRYRKKLASEYDRYLSLLIENINKDPKNTKLIEESKNIVLNIAANANNMQQNEKYDKNVLVDVSNIYFNNMYHLVKINYSNNEEEGYNYYCNIIKSNLEFIEENYKYNAIASELLKECYSNYYYELKDLKLSSKALNDFFTYIKIEKLKI